MESYQADAEIMIKDFKAVVKTIPDNGLGAEIKVMSAIKVSNALLEAMEDLDQNPYEILFPVIESETRQLSNIRFTDQEKNLESYNEVEKVTATRKLYENIWTIYNSETYEHSLQLCFKRFRANGFDQEFFSGKTVFDGGCGTGRFCIAAAMMGAHKVYGMDLGGQSLEFARKKAVEYEVADRVDFIEGDVTRLDRFLDESVDFIVSNGVLHHTAAPMNGLQEHFRILRKGGTMWLYLYGKDGLLWSVYDVLKDLLQGVGADYTRSFLLRMNVRQGMVYSFMDNVFAPIRNYYNTSYILDEMKKFGSLENSSMRGIGFLDDSVKQNESAFGRALLGTECEVRQIIVKQ